MKRLLSLLRLALRVLLGPPLPPAAPGRRPPGRLAMDGLPDPPVLEEDPGPASMRPRDLLGLDRLSDEYFSPPSREGPFPLTAEDISPRDWEEVPFEDLMYFGGYYLSGSDPPQGRVHSPSGAWTLMDLGPRRTALPPTPGYAQRARFVLIPWKEGVTRGWPMTTSEALERAKSLAAVHSVMDS